MKFFRGPLGGLHKTWLPTCVPACIIVLRVFQALRAHRVSEYHKPFSTINSRLSTVGIGMRRRSYTLRCRNYDVYSPAWSRYFIINNIADSGHSIALEWSLGWTLHLTASSARLEHPDDNFCRLGSLSIKKRLKFSIITTRYQLASSCYLSRCSL